MSTHAAKVLVQELHVSVDYLQRDQLVVFRFYGHAEVETGVPKRSVYTRESTLLKETRASTDLL